MLLFWVLSNVRPFAAYGWFLTGLPQGLLVLCILSGGGANKTFSSDSHGGETQRAYMVFILAFVAITSIIVSPFYQRFASRLSFGSGSSLQHCMGS